MFSLKLTDGASSVADAQLLMAESSAPKNMICAKIGTTGDRIRFGRMSCVSPPSFIAAATMSGWMRLAEYARNIGTNAKKKYITPPRIEELAAVFSVLRRLHALEHVLLRDRSQHHRDPRREEDEDLLQLRAAGSMWNLPFSAACDTTAVTPPGTMPLTSQPM